jgi:AraC family transcriptional regulator of adaptative response / DNA-3-methyladenine glycosylase II
MGIEQNGGMQIADQPTGPGQSGSQARDTEELMIGLDYRPPFDFGYLLEYLRVRAVPGIESAENDAYTRSLRLPLGPGVATLRQGTGGSIDCHLRLVDARDLDAAVAMCRQMLDLDSDPEPITATLHKAGFADLVDRHPGIRSPGHSDPVELALRTVLGQQISLAAAGTHLARLVARAGEPLPEALRIAGVERLFPVAEVIAGIPDEQWALPKRRIATIHALAQALADGAIVLDAEGDHEETSRRLLALPGIGPWSVGYMRMRALRDPDVFLHSDLGVKKALTSLEISDDMATIGQRSSPWGSYLTHLLWADHAQAEAADRSRTGTGDRRRS